MFIKEKESDHCLDNGGEIPLLFLYIFLSGTILFTQKSTLNSYKIDGYNVFIQIICIFFHAHISLRLLQLARQSNISMLDGCLMILKPRSRIDVSEIIFIKIWPKFSSFSEPFDSDCIKI